MHTHINEPSVSPHCTTHAWLTPGTREQGNGEQGTGIKVVVGHSCMVSTGREAARHLATQPHATMHALAPLGVIA